MNIIYSTPTPQGLVRYVNDGSESYFDLLNPEDQSIKKIEEVTSDIPYLKIPEDKLSNCFGRTWFRVVGSDSDYQLRIHSVLRGGGGGVSEPADTALYNALVNQPGTMAHKVELNCRKGLYLDRCGVELENYAFKDDLGGQRIAAYHITVRSSGAYFMFIREMFGDWGHNVNRAVHCILGSADPSDAAELQKMLAKRQDLDIYISQNGQYIDVIQS
jgi:hypothetical protein